MQYLTPKFDYKLPGEFIAQEPSGKRDKSRLMVLADNHIEHRVFSDIPDYISAGDCLVINKTKVIPARIYCRKSTGGKVELLMLKKLEGNLWTALSRDTILHKDLVFPDGTTARVPDTTTYGEFIIQFHNSADVDSILQNYGTTPLPPYIKKITPSDKVRYQTVYAQIPGSVAAPTAGLHFTKELLKRIKQKGVNIVEIVLHVNWGTFKPIRAEDIRNHTMLPEDYEVDTAQAEMINYSKRNKRKIFAVGTSVVRTLETLCTNDGKMESGKGQTDLYIYPGYNFKIVDGLLTNFHLPKTTPFVLVCAFCGIEKITSAYRTAIEKKYRFYSYGDAMLINGC